jgi:hypothetical protein
MRHRPPGRPRIATGSARPPISERLQSKRTEIFGFPFGTLVNEPYHDARNLDDANALWRARSPQRTADIERRACGTRACAHLHPVTSTASYCIIIPNDRIGPMANLSYGYRRLLRTGTTSTAEFSDQRQQPRQPPLTLTITWTRFHGAAPQAGGWRPKSRRAFDECVCFIV